jgi:hypothetical protein
MMLVFLHDSSHRDTAVMFIHDFVYDLSHMHTAMMLFFTITEAIYICYDVVLFIITEAIDICYDVVLFIITEAIDICYDVCLIYCCQILVLGHGCSRGKRVYGAVW